MVRKAKTPLRVKDLVIAGILSLGLVWLIFLNVSIFRKEEIARQAAHETQTELVGYQNRQHALTQDIAELSTERGKEATVRATYGVAKPGEEVIVVVPTAAATTTPPQTFWQKWFGWLGL